MSGVATRRILLFFAGPPALKGRTKLMGRYAAKRKNYAALGETPALPG